MNVKKSRAIFPALAIFLLLLAGCAATPPTKLYVLSSVAGAMPPVAKEPDAGPAIGLGPLSIPEYLDRPRIMTRVTENRLEAAGFHRWAEPLPGNISRVLAENLAALTSASRILLFPWKKNETPDRQVRIELLRFEAGPDDALHCIALWSVSHGEKSAGSSPRRTEISIVAQPGDFEAVVKAASEALARLSREIAEELRLLAARH